MTPFETTTALLNRRMTWLLVSWRLVAFQTLPLKKRESDEITQLHADRARRHPRKYQRHKRLTSAESVMGA